MALGAVFISSLLILFAAVYAVLPLLAVSVTTLIVSLTALGFRHRFLLGTFWLWVTLVLLYLASQPIASENVRLLVGLPLPTFWMLAGIWIFPVLIWPLGFALTFRRWIDS